MQDAYITKGLKFVFYRPHASIWFKNPVRNIIRKQRLPNKYESFFDYVINSDAEVYLTTALLPGNGLKGFIKSALEPLGLLLWCILNKISIINIHFILRKSSLVGKDAIFMMHYGTFTDETEDVAIRGGRLAEYLSDVEIFKVLHMTHYAYSPSIGASNLQRLCPDLLVAENDLSRNSPFYNIFFKDLSIAFRTLPYTPAPRFRRNSQFRDRVNKIVATGSITFKMTGSEFRRFYRSEELQPMRRTLYENAGKFTDEIECLISDLNASRDDTHKLNRKGIIRNLRQLLRYKHPQLNYYKRDIVDIYNSYTMFVVPEEICDLPAIGFIEGMACGCGYIGLDNPMYRDLGMIPGVHYISYDGTLPDLIGKAHYYQDERNFHELQEIANRGYQFATDRMNPKRVYEEFIFQLRTSIERKA